MAAALARIRAEYKIDAVQVEYTMLAPYAGDVLVEHDVTFALYRQIRDRSPGISQRWDLWRWQRFEKKWIRRYRKWSSCRSRIARCSSDRMSRSSPTAWIWRDSLPKSSAPASDCCSSGHSAIFRTSSRIDFSSNRFGPSCANIPPEITLTVVAGPDPLLYWREHTGLSSIPPDDRIRLLEFVSDVRPLYVEANLAIVPTLVSAGTNLKVLEAMAMDRAVVSTSSGCAGLGLEHSVNVWIADQPEDFARAIQTLLQDDALRRRIAEAGRIHVERNYGWRQIGTRQRALLRDLMPPRVRIRPAGEPDLPQIAAIQHTAPESSQWEAQDYLAFDCQVAVVVTPWRTIASPDSWFPAPWPIRNARS